MEVELDNRLPFPQRCRCLCMRGCSRARCLSRVHPLSWLNHLYGNGQQVFDKTELIILLPAWLDLPAVTPPGVLRVASPPELDRNSSWAACLRAFRTDLGNSVLGPLQSQVSRKQCGGRPLYRVYVARAARARDPPSSCSRLFRSPYSRFFSWTFATLCVCLLAASTGKCKLKVRLAIGFLIIVG